jgi:3-phosphoglycerate kinase
MFLIPLAKGGKMDEKINIIELLNYQANEIATEGHMGWGNTMVMAAERIKELEGEFHSRAPGAREYCRGCEYLSTIEILKNKVKELERDNETLRHNLRKEFETVDCGRKRVKGLEERIEKFKRQWDETPDSYYQDLVDELCKLVEKK